MSRRERYYNLTGNDLNTIILAATVLFAITGLSNFFLFYKYGALFIAFIDFATLALLGAYIWREDKSCRDDLEELREALRREAAIMEAVLKENPANTACREGLAETYEALGEFALALAHAKQAFQRDASEKNQWRVKTLKEKLKEDMKNR